MGVWYNNLQDMELETTTEHPLLSTSCTVNDMHASLSSMEQLSWIDQTLSDRICTIRRSRNDELTQFEQNDGIGGHPAIAKYVLALMV